jgi:large subunit ribosomal protein L29
MKASDLREKSVEDLKELGKSLTSDVFQNRLKNFTNRLDDTSAIRKTKRELARVTTLLREVELGIKRGAAAASDKSAPKGEATAKPAAPVVAKAEKPKAAAKKAPKAPEGKAEGASKAKTAKKSEAKKS